MFLFILLLLEQVRQSGRSVPTVSPVSSVNPLPLPRLVSDCLPLKLCSFLYKNEAVFFSCSKMMFLSSGAVSNEYQKQKQRAYLTQSPAARCKRYIVNSDVSLVTITTNTFNNHLYENIQTLTVNSPLKDTSIRRAPL